MGPESVIQKRRGQEDLIVRLKEVQGKAGFVSDEAMAAVAEEFDLPVNEIFAVASFYSFLSTKKLGRNVIRVCKSVPCYMQHSEAIVAALAQELGIQPGETTADGKFSLLLTNCIGLCDQAPAMLVNDDPHTDLTPGKISQILRGYK